MASVGCGGYRARKFWELGKREKIMKWITVSEKMITDMVELGWKREREMNGLGCGGGHSKR